MQKRDGEIGKRTVTGLQLEMDSKSIFLKENQLFKIGYKKNKAKGYRPIRQSG
ncbi:MAG: hypothetical protein ACK5MZ_09995 [Aestuariibaculum sp.]